jgi:MFS superfamily sulfate permease-like transporter
MVINGFRTMAPALRDEEAAMLIPQRPERPALDYGSSNSSSSPSSPRPVQNAPLNGLRHGLGHLGSFLPVCQWLRCYRIENLLGDTAAALTVATIYTPLCVSFALLAHMEPIKGIYSFTAATFLYALLGHGPGVIIGPEAPGSLLVGTAVLAQHHSGSHNSLDAANLVGLITATTGVILVIAGLTKLGFVSSFLNRLFLRGLMGGIGLTLLIEHAISELGLAEQGSHCAVAYGWGAVGTFRCLLKYLPKANLITTLISVLCFAFVMICR